PGGRGRRLALDRQVVVARPFVPRADVVACVEAQGAQHLHRDRRARAAVAVRHDFRSLRKAELCTNGVGAQLHEPVDVQVDGPGNMTLAGVALLPAGAVVLVRRAHVEDRDRAEPPGELLERDLSHRLRTTSTSAATAGRFSSSASHVASRSGSSTCNMSRTRMTQGTYAMSAKRLCPTSSSSSLAARSFGSPRRNA